MAESEFRIVYEGPALESGRMPVRELAPALLALGDLFAEASAVVYPDREPAALSIQATGAGSFEAHLILEAKRAWDAVTDIFGSEGATALSNLKDLVLVGLFLFIKKLRGRKIVDRQPSPAPGHVRVTLEDGTSIETSVETLRLYDRVTIRERAREVLEPLRSEGVDRVMFRPGDDAEPVTVDKDDLPAFELAASEVTPLGEQDREVVLQIAAITFVAGNKWRFTDGASVFWATLDDEAFLSRVERGEEAFRKGDMLRCVLRVTQTQDADGNLHADYCVLRVLEHLPRPHQLSLEVETG